MKMKSKNKEEERRKELETRNDILLNIMTRENIIYIYIILVLLFKTFFESLNSFLRIFGIILMVIGAFFICFKLSDYLKYITKQK